MSALTLGYPDWQRVVNWDGPVIWAQNTITTAGTIQSPLFDVSRFQSLGALLALTSGGALVRISWFADKAGATFLGGREVVLGNNVLNSCQLQLRNLGPYCQITITSAGGGNYTLAAQAWTTNRTGPVEVIPQQSILLKVISRAIAIGVTDVWQVSDYFDGPALLWADTGGLALTVWISAAARDGTFPKVWQVPAQTQLQSALISLPAAGCAVAVNNGSGSPATYSLTLTPSLTGAG